MSTRSTFVLLGLALSILVFVACGGSPPVAPEDVIYEAGANDEAWLEIDAARPTVDDARAPSLIAPTGAIAVDGPVVTFEWDGGAVAEGAAARGPAAPGRRDTFEWIARELFPLARAHGRPANGPIYRLELDFGTMVDPVRVLTGSTRYTPDATIWARIRDARRTYGVSHLHIILVGAFFTAGRITEGPYARTTDAQVRLD